MTDCMRSIDLELGNIYRELLEIKESDGRPAAKVVGQCVNLDVSGGQGGMAV